MNKKRRTTNGKGEFPPPRSLRHLLLFAVGLAMETVLLALVCLSPWAYGSVHPGFEFLLDAGIAVLLGLWAVRMLLEGQVVWKKSVAVLCLASLFLLGIWQQTPLPRSVLAWLSPGTVRCYDQLLPKQAEILPPLSAEMEPSVSAASHATTPPGSTLSLYPGATQGETMRLLAVFLVFAVVYNNLTSKEALIRLSWAALINGVLLSLFALFQFFAAPPQTVYWVFSSQVTPFGPFICHNHFPDYVNMCIGLSIGLLVSGSRRDRSSASMEEDVSPLQLLHHPRALGICCALGLMFTAVAFSLSRGGLLALVGTAVVCGVLARLRLDLSFRLGSILVIASVVIALSAWFGIDLVKSRLTTLETGEALESRVPLWLRSLPIIPDFPVWGTGYGTFGYVERMYRKEPPANKETPVWWCDHAHSDYLEILIEGGVVGLGLAVLAFAAIFRLGYRALKVNRGSRRQGLALGALFAFMALALHSLGEFGAHIPAITLLATVISAHLCALGHSKFRRNAPSKEDASADAADPRGKDVGSDEYHLRLAGVAPVFGAVAALGLGLALCVNGWKAHRIDRLEDAAFRAGSENIDQLQTRIAYLTQATLLGPEDAQLHYELGYAHEQLAKMLIGGALPDRPAVHEQRMLALREYVLARNACPLLSGAHLGIAAYASLLKQGDTAENYLRRAKLLSPVQDETWYLCGLREFTLGHFQDAWATWRHCLELSDRYLPQILSHTFPLKPNQLVEQVLPDKPEVLLAAALRLYPDYGMVERRRPFLEKALRLLESKGDGLGEQELLVKAQAYKALEQPDQAIQAYRELLNRNGSQTLLRYEFAKYLHEVRRLEEARHELTVLLAQDPKNGSARTLLDTVVREMLREKSQERSRQQEDWWLRRGRLK